MVWRRSTSPMRKYVVDHPLVGRHQSLIDRAAVTEDEQGIPGRYEGHRRTVLDGITKGCLALHRIGMPVAEVRWAPLVRWASVDQIKKMTTRLHRMDEQLVTAVEGENDEFQKPSLAVETHDELLGWYIVVRPALVDPVVGSVKCVRSTDAMLERRVVDFHATKARTAERMISERLVPSSSARWSTAATRLSSMRTGTTRAAPSPMGRRPRFFSTSTSYPRSASSAHSWIISSVTGTPSMVSIRQV